MATKNSPKNMESPHFEPCRVLGGAGNFEIVADTNGALWQLDIKKGHAKPVTYSPKK